MYLIILNLMTSTIPYPMTSNDSLYNDNISLCRLYW